jgi:hypothetical protein
VAAVRKLRISKRLLVGVAALALMAGSATIMMPATAHAQPVVPWGAKIVPGVPVAGSFVVDGKRYPVYRPRVSRRASAELLAAMGARGATRSRRGSVRPMDYLTDEITNVHSGKCLEVYDWGTANGDQVDQWTCGSPQQANQTWEWELEGSVSIPGGSGECCDIFELVNKNSGKCLEVYNWGTSNDSKIDQWTCYGDPNQEWLEDPGLPCYQGVYFEDYDTYLLGDPEMVFEVYGQSTSNGGKVDLYSWNGGENQLWNC